MKKTICFLLAFIMLMALMAAPAAAEEETVPTETAAPVTEPAPDSADPVGEPAPEIPAEPAETPTEPAPETPAEPTEAPADAAAGEPAADPGIITTSLEPESVPEQETEERRVLTLYPEGGVFPGERWNYPTITTTLSWEGTLGDLTYCQPVRTGYRFVGWYTAQYADYAAAVAAGANPVQTGEAVAEEVTELHACWVRTVVLDAEPGSFLGGDQTYTRTIDLVNGTLPTEGVDAPVFNIDDPDQDAVKFIGWYTQKCSVTQTPDQGNGAYWNWDIQPQGTPIAPGAPVPEGVTTLYAAYQLQETADTKVVTYYYDWNGINGMYGHCLTSTRHYDASVDGVKMDVGNAAIAGLNWDGQTEFATWADMEAHWASYNNNNGYTFLGWATDPKAATPNIGEGYVIKNGVSLYAVWTKGDRNNQTFDRNPAEAGPLEFMRFDDGNHLNYSVHAGLNKSVTMNLACFPIGCQVDDLTWTVKYTDGTLKGAFNSKEITVKAGESKTTEDGYFQISAAGQSLTITDLDGMEHGFTVTATAKSKNGDVVNVAAGARGGFNHSTGKWETVVEPTCTEYGKEKSTCADCNMEVTRVIYPLQHAFDFRVIKDSTCTEEGLYGKVCTRPGCNATYADYMAELGFSVGSYQDTVIAKKSHTYTAEGCSVCGGPCVIGDANGDGNHDVGDVRALFMKVSGAVSEVVPAPVGDINQDGNVDVGDVRALFMCASGAYPFPVN